MVRLRPRLSCMPHWSCRCLPHWSLSLSATQVMGYAAPFYPLPDPLVVPTALPVLGRYIIQFRVIREMTIEVLSGVRRSPLCGRPRQITRGNSRMRHSTQMVIRSASSTLLRRQALDMFLPHIWYKSPESSLGKLTVVIRRGLRVWSLLIDPTLLRF